MSVLLSQFLLIVILTMVDLLNQCLVILIAALECMFFIYSDLLPEHDK